MTISQRLLLGFVIIALLFATALSVTSGAREFKLQRDAIVATADNQLRGRPDLQVHMHRRDSAALENTLATFLQPPAVSGVILYDGLGEQIAEVSLPQVPKLASAPFSRVRGNLLAVDAELLTLGKDGERRSPGMSTLLFATDAPVYYTRPVFSLVNPGTGTLTAADIARALMTPQPTSTRWVVGYMHLLVDPRALRDAAFAAGARVFALALLFIALASVLCWYLLRRVTRPLRELTRAADQLAAGQRAEPLPLEGSGELQEFIRVINGFLGGLNNLRSERDVDKRLLNLKVEERTNQLSERARELDQAVQEVEQTRTRLEQVANYDPLTRLPNRQLFQEKLDLLLKLNQRSGNTLALLCIELDGLRRINDALGLTVGDQLLGAAAERLVQAVRESDSVGHFANDGAEIAVSRLGSDEFTVVLNQVDDRDAARLVALRVAAQLAEPVSIDGHELVLRPCVGLALAPEDGTDVHALLRAASLAKRHARETTAATPVTSYVRAMASEDESRMRLEADLRKAIERQELSLHFQPQVDSHSGSVIGAEALLRWQHPEHGMVPPVQFIAMAEEIGYMATLGEWVLEAACEQLRRFNDSGAKLPRVAINVSALEFDSRFARRVLDVVAQAGVANAQLELGLSENIMTQFDADTAAALQLLRESGVYLSVDDFGTGYSPLGYLAQYPLDELKINRQLLAQSGRTETGTRLLTAIIAMARSLDLRVLATGVETAEEFKMLAGNGVHLLQGYLLSPPVPADELRAMLTPWHFVDQLQQLSNGADQPS